MGRKFGLEGETLFHDNDDDIPQDPYLDEFHDEDGNNVPPLKMSRPTSSRSMEIMRRGRWKRYAMLCCCLVLVLVGIVVAMVGGSLLGGNDDDDDSNKNVVLSTPVPTMAPVSMPVPTEAGEPTFAPTGTNMPTRTAYPTRALYWSQVADDFGSVTDAELEGSAVDISADGQVVWYGAFNYTAPDGPPMVGRIRRLNVATNTYVDVYGTHEGDSLGYQVCGSADGEYVVGFTSSNGTLIVYDYMESQNSLRAYAEATLPSNWDSMTVVFDLSKDGLWLAVTGAEVKEGEPGEEEVDWNLIVYELIKGEGGELKQFGPQITIESSLSVIPRLYSIDVEQDASVIAVGIVGVEEAQGRVRVYNRMPGQYYAPMGDMARHGELFMSAARANDFYARRLQVRTMAGRTYLAIGWEGRNTVLMRFWDLDSQSWVGAGELKASDLEYSPDAEFGYDFDLSEDGTRMIVGVRCFNYCQGADQVFQLVDGVWTGLGQIIVGYEDTFFGEGVAISGDGNTIVVGAPEECNDQGICGGAIYVYSYIGPDLPSTGGLTAAPVAAGSPTPAPTPRLESEWPTQTAMPTTAFGWEQTNGVFDSVDQELFAASVALSGDGSVLFVGAFENGEFAPESGRIVRIDMANGNSELVVYGDEYDFLGFDVSSNHDGSRVVGYLSSSSLLEVADYSNDNGRLQMSAQLPTAFNSTSATFSLSADGRWLAAIGVLDAADGLGGTLTVKTYQLSNDGQFVPFGSDLSLEDVTVAPTLDIHLLQDGSYMALAVAGWNGYAGQVRAYRRTTTGWELAGNTITSDQENDFFGKTIRLSQRSDPEELTLLFVAAPYRNQVIVYSLTPDGSSWAPYGPAITSSSDFTDEDEFGFDIDTSYDGTRVLVGIRCFDACRGAAQVFEHDGANWHPLGQIIAGFADSYFGEAVNCNSDCNIIAVGAPEDCGDDGCGGSVYVFEGNDNRIP